MHSTEHTFDSWMMFENLFMNLGIDKLREAGWRHLSLDFHYGLIRLTVPKEIWNLLSTKVFFFKKSSSCCTDISMTPHLLSRWAHSCKGREFGSLIKRGIVIVIDAAVGRPQVGRNGHSVDVVSTDHPTRHGDPRDYVRLAAAVVVESAADDVLVLFPVAHIELADLWDHIGEGVRGCLVIGVSLVLVGVQMASFEINNVWVVFQDGLGVWKTVVDIIGRKWLHLTRVWCCGELNEYRIFMKKQQDFKVFSIVATYIYAPYGKYIQPA